MKLVNGPFFKKNLWRKSIKTPPKWVINLDLDELAPLGR